MKHYKQILWTVTFLLFVLTACEKDPFAGTDNYLLDFSLQNTDGRTFDARIADNIVLLNIPENIDMEKLTPKYTVSELATISPKPETVKNWSTEQAFTITSRNGTPRQYTVKMVKKDVIFDESVYLRTDEEVAAFAAKKISIINGDLVIGAPTGTDSISNVNALAELKEVRYKLIVNPTYKGIDLAGLKNLKKAGSIIIHGEFKQLTKIEFPEIEVIQENLSVRSKEIIGLSLPKMVTVNHIRTILPKLDNLNLEQLQHISELELKGTFEWYEQSISTIEDIQLPNLITSDKIYIENLSSIKKIDLSKLETCNGYLYIHRITDLNTLNLDRLKYVNELKLFMLDKLKEVDMPLLEKGVDISFERTEAVETIKIPNLKIIDKRLSITGNSLTDISSINKLEEAKSIGISAVKLSSVQPLLSSLRIVEDFNINTMPLIEKVDASNTVISGSLRIIDCANTKSIALPKKIENTFELNLASNASITTLPEITGLEECKRFIISNASGVKEIKLPASLKKVTQLLSFMGNALTVSGDNLQEAGEITYSANNLTSMSFPRLEKVSGKLSIFGKFLEDIQLPKLTSVGRLEVGGSYSGWQNEKLLNLNFLASLTSLETLEIKFCKVLTDYSGLKNAVNSGCITAENWTVKSVHDNAYNPTFEDIKAGRYVKP